MLGLKFVKELIEMAEGVNVRITGKLRRFIEEQTSQKREGLQCVIRFIRLPVAELLIYGIIRMKYDLDAKNKLRS